MRRYLFKTFCVLQLFLLVNITPLFSQAPWKWLHPYPTGSILNALHVFDSNHFLAVGNTGTIVQNSSDEDSLKVVIQLLGERLTINDVFFINDQVGWICGWRESSPKGVILKTIDGGKTWQYSLKGSEKNCLNIFFLNDQMGWVSCYNRYLLKTTDGGENWQTIDLGSDYALSDLYFMDADTGIALGRDYYGKIYRSVDGGQSWSTLSTGYSFNFRSISFPATSGGRWGIVVGYSGKVMRTTDYGRSWEFLYTGDDSNYETVQFLNDTLGWLAGWNGKIFKTYNGGNFWQELESPTEKIINSLFFIDKYNGYAVGYGGEIIKTTDGGQSWQHLNKKYTDGSMRLLYFFTEDSIWALGDKGAIFSSSDHGQTWNFKKAMSYNYLRDFTFSSSDTGWIISANSIDNSCIEYTNDGGALWEKMNDLKGNFYAISFTGNHQGWIVGENGVMYQTDNGGRNWEKVETGTTDNLFKIFILNDKQIRIIGRSGTILRSDDAGEQWSSQVLPDASFGDGYFLNTQVGWLVNSDGKMWQTTDGGLNWSSSWDVPRKFICTKFQSPERGWALTFHDLYLSEDGGKTWRIVASFDWSFFMNSFYLLDQNKMILLGESGTILQLNLDELVGVEAPAEHLIPVSMQLFQNYPNPFNPVTNIRYRLVQGGPVHLTIYNLWGQRVRTLVNGRQSPGEYMVRWDGRNEAGRSVSSGLYFYRLQTGDKQLMRKMLLVR